ncbi:sensor histidine kinase [Gorillibacterium timonense]|uniref:sensor histidine kinase n=1 Tax=Gorillibacterium timonense TaxID=1689269 RepID=UPI00071D0705|nr:sensor histidine kinase [Gorillibacterium timonense]
MKRFSVFPKKYGYYPFIWPIYLILPVINLQGETGGKLILGYFMLLVFLVSYRQLYWVHGKAFSIWLGIQMAITVILGVLYNPYCLYLGFFSANFIGWHSSKTAFNRAYATFAASILLPLILQIRQLSGTDFIYLLPFFMIMLVSPFGIRSLGRKQQLEKDLGAAREQIAELVKHEERVRIARDLHDTLGHTLSLITLKSQLVEKLIAKNPERAAQEARDIEQTSRAALRQVRELVSNMRALTITEELASSTDILDAAGITLRTNYPGDLSAVNGLTQNILGLCIKEAVTNIVKHSGAKECLIQVKLSPSLITLSIEDDGFGLGSKPHSNGNGIKGMQERLALIEGTLEIGSRMGNPGTRLSVRVPIVQKGKKEGDTA